MKRSPAPWTAPGEACHRNSTSNGTLQQHPSAHQQPGSKAQRALWHQHLAAAPCSGTLHQQPSSKRKHVTLPILEVIAPIASLSGAKKTYTRKKVNYGTRSTMEKASRRGGKTAIMYDWVQISNHKIWVKHSKTVWIVWRAPFFRCDFNKMMRL